MDITAVTIGIGEPYLHYAKKACKEIKKLLNINTKIITEDYLEYATGSHEQERIWSLKFSIFDIFPEIDTVMYFDVDWRPLQSFNILDYCSDINKIYFTPDDSNSSFIQELEKKYKLLPGTYVNAGWFVANKKFKKDFNYCRDNLTYIDRSFYGDQCVINQVLREKITLANKRLNTFTLNEFPKNEILGLHNKDINYNFYKNFYKTDKEYMQSITENLKHIEVEIHRWESEIQKEVENLKHIRAEISSCEAKMQSTINNLNRIEVGKHRWKIKFVNDRNILLDFFPKNLKVAELGVFKGDYSKVILDKLDPEELYLVDIFPAGVSYSGDKDGINPVYEDLEKFYPNLIALYKEDKRVKIIKDTSHSFLESLPDDYLDIVYIDADHSFESVKKDLELSLKKVKNNGIIAGHDYMYMRDNDEITRAVNEFCKQNNREVTILTKDRHPTFVIYNALAENL